MKKIISFLIITISLLNYWDKTMAADTLSVSAVVGNSNHKPVVIETNPDLNPNYLAHSSWTDLIKQNYYIKFRDDEADDVTYTITTQSDWWAVNPTSWTITDYNVNNEAYIFFEYISPTIATNDIRTITVTISDWPNITIQTLNVYIY